jgi:HAD superfamily hydrolase (TIGR01493 family)
LQTLEGMAGAMSDQAVKVVAFDVFGTVFDLAGVDREEIRAYVEHIRQPQWEPLTLPESWKQLPAFSDAPTGIRRLRTLGHCIVVTCSNGPISLLVELSRKAGIEWDFMIPLEVERVYKTNPRAYMLICDILKVSPHEVMFVTANENFGDIEAANSLGMKTALIRGETGKTIIELAESLYERRKPHES